MFNITILTLGSVKERYFKEAIDEYLKRMKPYSRVSIHELGALPFNDKNHSNVKTQEAQKIIKFLDKQKDKYVIALDESGKNYSSKEFSGFLSSKNREIIFVIGGSLGFSEDIYKRVDARISLSSMTFPHEVARLLLCEQIYRAITIEKGKTYHY